MSCLVITGTDTGVGKTIVTAALACNVRVAGGDVTVCKPVQTGTDGGVDGADGDDDLVEVSRLSGVADLVSGWRYPEPLAPLAAAQRAGLALPTRGELVDLVTANDRPGRLVLVEGAGGLLVDIGTGDGMDEGAGVTLRDVATDLQAAVLVVVRAGLGTLNHALLTVEALATRNVRCAGLVVGAWPVHPGPVESSNLEALGRIAPIRAVLPAGLARVSPEEFAAVSAQVFPADWVQSL